MIPGRDRSDPKMSGRFYLAVVRAVLFFVFKTLMVTPYMGDLLGSFYHRVEERLSGMQLRRHTDGMC